MNNMTDAHHEKTDLKVFVVVIPKERWAHVAAPMSMMSAESNSEKSVS